MIENIEKLKTMSPREVQIIYKNFFSSSEGQLILEDIKSRFWEYVQPEGGNEYQTCLRVGQQSVLMYIKNQINPPDESIFDRQPEESQ